LCPVTAALVCSVSELCKRGLSSYDGTFIKSVGGGGSFPGKECLLHYYGKAFDSVIVFGLEVGNERIELEKLHLKECDLVICRFHFNETTPSGHLLYSIAV